MATKQRYKSTDHWLLVIIYYSFDNGHSGNSSNWKCGESPPAAKKSADQKIFLLSTFLIVHITLWWKLAKFRCNRIKLFAMTTSKILTRWKISCDLIFFIWEFPYFFPALERVKSLMIIIMQMAKSFAKAFHWLDHSVWLLVKPQPRFMHTYVMSKIRCVPLCHYNHDPAFTRIFRMNAIFMTVIWLHCI